MLGSLRKFFSGQGLGADDWADAAQWAKHAGHLFKPTRDGTGFVVEAAGAAWRMEFGPPQRDYIAGRELRLRAELGTRRELQLMVIARPLAEQLERRMFEDSTEATRTQINPGGPDEQRWLAMMPKVDLGGSRLLRTRFVAVAAAPEQGTAWLAGPLTAALDRAATLLLALEPPMVLILQRGRLALRLQQPSVDERVATAAVELFDAAAAAAKSVPPG